ncbi:MAG: hypothetical protein JJU29_17275 [Verrucomicrobia bacterium]|nr:hypothetical protein [Verrucomicrobiota bacterium]MCH8513035.1 hypothetical protein [Kiritimatiellia bacterium]
MSTPTDGDKKYDPLYQLEKHADHLNAIHKPARRENVFYEKLNSSRYGIVQWSCFQTGLVFAPNDERQPRSSSTFITAETSALLDVYTKWNATSMLLSKVIDAHDGSYSLCYHRFSADR